jgi:hypothetical protein
VWWWWGVIKAPDTQFGALPALLSPRVERAVNGLQHAVLFPGGDMTFFSDPTAFFTTTGAQAFTSSERLNIQTSEFAATNSKSTSAGGHSKFFSPSMKTESTMGANTHTFTSFGRASSTFSFFYFYFSV